MPDVPVPAVVSGQPAVQCASTFEGVRCVYRVMHDGDHFGGAEFGEWPNSEEVAIDVPVVSGQDQNGPDWTSAADGRSNSSPLFLHLCDEVEELIRSEARLIMAQLAHIHGLAPWQPVLPDPEKQQ